MLAALRKLLRMPETTISSGAEASTPADSCAKAGAAPLTIASALQQASAWKRSREAEIKLLN
jgi:hypothetical protein